MSRRSTIHETRETQPSNTCIVVVPVGPPRDPFLTPPGAWRKRELTPGTERRGRGEDRREVREEGYAMIHPC